MTDTQTMPPPDRGPQRGPGDVMTTQRAAYAAGLRRIAGILDDTTLPAHFADSVPAALHVFPKHRGEAEKWISYLTGAAVDSEATAWPHQVRVRGWIEGVPMVVFIHDDIAVPAPIPSPMPAVAEWVHDAALARRGGAS